ncbi:tripartite motif-containing protein 59-like [Scyliorhinus canicula]|uniref:tripartite motif-containing protein 59-like n=1 Tax=Scyliorhinus canicula TaxID=7830 RepID=UPI0018F30A14|nr:tripartite motif-containing protein 59-like [Scyliorhinus canicula]
MFEKRMKESEHLGISKKMQPIEGIRCTVCLEDYSLETERRPRILPQCLHTFCEGCLEKLVEFSDFHVVCPICRVANDVADAGGVQSLPISTRISLPSQTSSQCQDLSILRFMDPDAPACPACGSLTLYAPLGQDETVTQCHTCGWLGTGTPEVQSNLIHERDSLPRLNQGNPGPTVQRPSLIAGLCELLRNMIFGE